MTLVSVGNAKQPFDRLLDLVECNVDCLPQPVRVQHGHTPFNSNKCEAIPFMDMEEFCRNVHESVVLITHAGAGTVIHALQAGRIPAVMPRLAANNEHVDNHQLEMAKALADEGKVVLLEDDADFKEVVRRVQQLQTEFSDRCQTDMLSMLDICLSRYANQITKTGI